MIYRRADAADAGALAEFAARVFVASYEHQLPRAELEALARAWFTFETQHAQLAAADQTTFLAIDADLAGYARVIIGSRPPSPLTGRAPAELKRIYVDAAWHGQGVAPQLMHLVEAEARDHGCDVLWLLCWAENQRAIAFYLKHGFETFDTAEFAVGNWLLRHHYMFKHLSDLPQS